MLRRAASSTRPTLPSNPHLGRVKVGAAACTLAFGVLTAQAVAAHRWPWLVVVLPVALLSALATVGMLRTTAPARALPDAVVERLARLPNSRGQLQVVDVVLNDRIVRDVTITYGRFVALRWWGRLDFDPRAVTDVRLSSSVKP